MAGQNADMTLKVGLDLNFFKQELQKASSSLAGQPIDINIRFNKKGIADQYRLLTRYLGGKKSFDVKIESNTLDALTDKVANFQKTLKNLKDEKVELSINASANIEKFSKEKIRKIRAQIRSDIVSGGAGEIQLPTKLAAPNTSAFIKDVAKKVKEQTSASYAEGGIPIATKLKVPGITDLLKALQKNLNRNPISIATSFKESGRSEAALAKIIRNAEKNKAVLGTELAPLGADEIAEFRRTVESKLSGIKVTVDATLGKGFAAGQTGLAGLEEYMRTQGLSGGPRGAVETGRRAQFESLIGSASRAELKRYMKTAEIAGRSALTTKAQMQEALLKINDVAMENILGNMKMQMRDPLPIKKSFLDQVARAVFWMAGVDPAYLKQQAAQRRALPSVNFPATVPPRNVSIGPSGTGRALPPGAIPSALPGTAFGAQRYLPTALSDELKTILRGAAFAFVDSLKQQVRSTRIGLGATQQPLLGASRIAGLLPAGVGRAPSVYSTGAIGGETRAEMMARREREARMRSALRGMDVMGGGAGRTPSPYSYAYRGARPTSAIVPYAAGGAIVPQPAMAGGGIQPPGGGGGGGMGGFGGFGRALGGVPNLPGTGTIRELGSEFAFATKQVLLFGQAYKLLGILQDFPSQVGAAVGQLQSFRNTLNTIAPTAEEVRASNELIIDLMNRYNVPLQSARDGFTKLYASMAPAGFSGDEIRGLFTGITKAAATFGMSADKVDRVNYAFAQMASKGQVMSEELKGQLGDVLPGAMALFAEAAGFEGPTAIQDFSAALEDGAYKGEAMVALLKNVGVVMNKEFGPGAEGAARTFQGVINRMQNSMTLLYESFEPVAVGFLNTVVAPMTNGIKQLSDGLNAFFSGTAAKTEGGFAIAKELERLRPAFDGIGQNVQKLIPVFQQFANTALGIAKVLLEIAGNPFIGYLARIYASVLPLTIAIQALNLRALVPMIANFLRAIPAFVAYTAATAQGVTANKALQLSMQVTGSTAATTAGQIRSVGTAIKAAFTGTLVLAAVAGIGMIIEKIISLNAQMADTRAKALDAARAIRSMSQTEARQAAQQYEAGALSLKALNEQVEQGKMKGKAWIEVTSQQAKALQDAGVIVSDVRGSLQVQPTRIPGAFQKLEGLAGEARYRERAAAFAEREAQTPAVLGAIPEVGGDDKKKAGRKTPLNEILDLETQRVFKMREADVIARLEERISDAKRLGNEYEAESLESTRRALTLGIELAALQDYSSQLIEKEGELVGETLSKEAYNNKLQDANVQIYVRQLELRTALRKISDADLEQQKKIQEEQRKFAETLLNIKNENGLISTQEYNRLKIDEQIRKILEEFPSLTEQQKKEVESIIRNKQTQLKVVREEIELLRAINDTERRRIELQREGYTKEKIKEIIDLEKVRDNIQATREIIDNFVNDTSSDYKGFLKEVISGEDAVDALKKFQEGLKDRVLTIFLDFTMAPVEEFFKEVMGGKLIETLFPKTDLEKQPETKPATPIEENTTALGKATTAIDNLTTAIQGGNQAPESNAPATPQRAAFSSTASSFGTAGIDFKQAFSMPQGLPDLSAAFSPDAPNILGTAMADIDLSQYADAFSTGAESLNESMGSIVDTTYKAAEEAGPNGGAGAKWQESLGKTVQGIGIAAGAIMGIMAGINQIKEGGTSNVLGGIGSILLGVGGAIGGFAGMVPKSGKAANGAVWKGGFQAFANGGMVTGPTLGLIGEGRYNEAIVPLPDGKSIPVQMRGQSSRDLLSDNARQQSSSPVLSMSFQTTKFGDREYVDVAQLQAAMAETRKMAARDGANRGASLALDKLQNSPSARRKVGMR